MNFLLSKGSFLLLYENKSVELLYAGGRNSRILENGSSC
jgi:hypothetical protein